MRSVDGVQPPSVRHGTAELRTRLLRQYLLVTTSLYAVGVTVSLLPHGDRVTSPVAGGVVAVVVGVAALLVLAFRPRGRVALGFAVGAAMIATPAVMAFHVLTASQFMCLIAVMFLAMYIRAFHNRTVAQVLVIVLVVAVCGAAAASPAQLYPISYLVFAVAVVGAAEAFGSVTRALIDASHTDPLTGVRNRAGWEMAVSEVTTSSITVVALDVDGFKAINDTSGHSAGDRFLISLARSWSDLAPPGTVIARLGGDEFAALVHGASPTVSRAFADATAAAFPHVSVGCAVSAFPGESASDVLARADADLYQVKRKKAGVDDKA